MKTLEFWFDYSCPYAYLASVGVEALAASAGARLEWRPMLLGGVFAAHATPQNLAATLSPQRARHLAADLARLADLAGVELRFPTEHPRRTVLALRATLARGCEPAVIHAFFRAYWVEGRAIEDEAVVRAIATPPGARLDFDAWRDELRARTEEAVALGIFGAPTYVVRDPEPQLWWGGDRARFVEAALR